MLILTEQESSAPTMPYCTTEVRCRARQPHRVVLIPGDGIGPEVAEATARAVEATGISLEWERVELNGKTIAKCGGLVTMHVTPSIEIKHMVVDDCRCNLFVLGIDLNSPYHPLSPCLLVLNYSRKGARSAAFSSCPAAEEERSVGESPGQLML